MTPITSCLNICALINSQKTAQTIQPSTETDKAKKNNNKLPTKKELDKLNYHLEHSLLNYINFFDAPRTPQGIPEDKCVTFLESFIAKYPNLSYITYLKLALIHVYIRRSEFEKAFKLCGEIPPQENLLNHEIIEKIIVFYPELRDFDPLKVKEAYRKIADRFGQAIPKDFLPLIISEVLTELGANGNKHKSYEKVISQLFPPNLPVSPRFIFTVYINALPAFLQIIGDHYFNSQQYKKALNIYLQILDSYPSLPQTNEIRLNTGKAHEKCGEQEKAIAMYKKIPSDANWYYAKAQLQIGELYLKQNDVEESVFHLQNALNSQTNLSSLDISAATAAFQHLTELALKNKDYASAIEILEKLAGHASLQEKPHIKFKIAYIAFLMALNKGTSPKKSVIPILNEIIDKYPNSPIAQRALLFKHLLEETKDKFKLKTVYKQGNITIKRLEGINSLSLLFLNNNYYPELIPGKLTIRNSGTEIYIPKYYGKFTVALKRPAETIPTNNDALLLAYRVLPNGFFEGFEKMVFTGKKSEFDGEYSENDVTVFQSSDPLRTIVHELAHHWDSSVASGIDGKNLGLGDLSQIYYDISWTPDKIEKEIWGGDFGKKEMDRADFDEEDFIGEYSLCNREEDFATMVEEYVTNGMKLRERIQKQLEKGNFELAAKYLFVRYLSPFRGREYQLNDDSLGFEKVELQLETWLKDHPNSVESSTIEAINKIKEKYKEIIYK